jgi:hypothetical protein
VRFSLVSILIAVALAIASCASSSLSSTASAANAKLQSQGLPFRWTVENSGDGEVMVMHLFPLPVAASRADAQVTGEILSAIRRREQSKGRANVELKEVRQMTDGREVWVLRSVREGIAYVVSLGSPNQGITKVGVLGPYSFAQ